jgi:HEAT repeat protein
MPRIAILAVALAAFASSQPVAAQRDGVVRKQLERRGGEIRLPSRDRPGEESAAPVAQDPRVDGRDEAFARAMSDMRRSLFLSSASEQQLLLQLGQRFDRIPERALSLARHADADTLYACMRTLEIYGLDDAATYGDRIKFLLLTRPFRKATDVGVDTMVHLLRDGAKDALFALLISERAIVRSAAEERLADVLAREGDEADAARLLALARQGDGSIALQATRLLGFLPNPSAEVDAFLVDAMSREPNLAIAAVDAVARRGEDALPLLTPVLEKPAVDRSFGYAALALARIEETRFDVDPLAPPLFTAAMRPHLHEELTAPDAFMRSAVALGLAELAWRSDEVDARDDREIAGALVQVVAPRAFVTHLSDLQDLAHKRLARFAGRDFGLEFRSWLDWWNSIEEVEGWVGVRADVRLAERDAPLAVVTIPTEPPGRLVDPLADDAPRVWRFRGDRVDWLEKRDDAFEIVLGATEMMLLVERLRGAGFPRSVMTMSANEAATMRPVPAVELQVGGARCTTPARTDVRSLGRFVSIGGDVVEEQTWQLYRNPEVAPDLLAWWRAEHRWRVDHAGDEDALTDRFVGHVVDLLATTSLKGARLRLALSHLTAIPDLHARITRERGLGIVRALEGLAEWGEGADALMTIALRAEDDSVWRELLSVAEQRVADGASPEIIGRIFHRLGGERLLEAFDHPSRGIRLLAIQEAADAGATTAIPPLMEIVRNGEDPVLRRTAVISLGRLRAIEAEELLTQLADDQTIDPAVRRATWVALGRIGAPHAMDVISRAQLSTDDEDRKAVIEAAGVLRTPESVELLAGIYGIRGEDELGLLAKGYLRDAGDLLAAPALRRLLDHRDENMRRNVVLLLGEFQDRTVLEALIQLLGTPASYRAAQLIETITGIELVERNERASFARQWLARNVRKTQGEWLVDALAAHEVRTSLTADQLGLGARPATVRELCRLLVGLDKPHLRCLAAKVLRQITEHDFGLVLPRTDEVTRQAIADRYLFLIEEPESAANTRGESTGRVPR